MQIRLRDFQNREISIGVSTFANKCRDFAFLRFFDAAAVKDDDEMQPLDWAVSTLLQAPIRQYKPLDQLASNKSEMWKACNEALKGLGKDLPLENETADSKRDAVNRCFSAFMAPAGIGPSIASKTLHKKRPQLLPVVDDYVARFFIHRDADALSSSRVTDVIFDHFRPQLLKNLAAVETARKQLEEFKLSNGRLLDIAIWCHVDSNKAQYGVPLRKEDKAAR